jgi:hypothetical protein
MNEPAILKAFEEGGKAARMDKPRSSNRYMPGSEPELYQAWNAGYDEEEPRYAVVHRG